MKRRLLLALEFVAITASLGWLWIEWGRDAYVGAFVWAATPVFIVLGVRQLEVQLIADHFINFVPFLALIIVTPRLTMKRRMLGGLIGIAAILAGHILLSAVAYLAKSRYGLTAKAFTTLFPAYLLNDSLPFILWAAVAWSQVKLLASRLPFGNISTSKVESGSARPRDSSESDNYSGHH
jgi:hypothetical protein